MPWHESIIEAELAKTKVLVNATSDGARGRRVTDPGRDPAARPPGAGPHLRPDPPAPRRGGGGLQRLRRRGDAPPPGRRRVHPVDGPAGARSTSWARRWPMPAPAGSGRPRASPPARRARRPPKPRRADDLRWTASASSPPGRATARCWAPWSRACPPGLALTEDDLAVDLARRQRGYGRGARQAIEQDRARILSGVRHGRTLGSPILLEVENRDWANWTRVMQVGPLVRRGGRGARGAGRRRATSAPSRSPASGPATRTSPGSLKYGFNDVRNVLERSSARETAARVAAGGVARAFLRELGIEVWSFTAEVGGVAMDPARCTRTRDEADASPLRCPDPDAEAAMIARIDEARSQRRHGRRRVRGRGPRRPHRPRQLRPVGPAPGRRAGARRS